MVRIKYDGWLGYNSDYYLYILGDEIFVLKRQKYKKKIYLFSILYLRYYLTILYNLCIYIKY